MSVPYNNIVNVSIGIAPTPAALPGFGNLLFLASLPTGVTEANRVTTFGNLTEVTSGHSDTEVIAAATAYFAQVPTPNVFMVGAVLGAETPLEGLIECGLFDGSFNEVITDKVWRDSADAIAVSDFCQGSGRIFGNTTNDASVLDTAAAAGTIAGQIDAKSNGLTVTSYSSVVAEYPSASVLGRINTVNYQGTNTTLTLMFKILPTITVSSINSTQKAALESINVNSFMKVGATSLYSDGRMAGGGWLDTVHGVSWLEKQIQLNVFNLLYASTTKISYTDGGIALVVQQVDLALRQAVRNGLVAAGNDSEGTYIPAGYEIFSVPVAEVSASDKGNRIYNGITFKAVGAGAIHGSVITGSFT